MSDECCVREPGERGTTARRTQPLGSGEPGTNGHAEAQPYPEKSRNCIVKSRVFLACTAVCTTALVVALNGPAWDDFSRKDQRQACSNPEKFACPNSSGMLHMDRPIIPSLGIASPRTVCASDPSLPPTPLKSSPRLRLPSSCFTSHNFFWCAPRNDSAPPLKIARLPFIVSIPNSKGRPKRALEASDLHNLLHRSSVFQASIDSSTQHLETYPTLA